MKYFLYLFLLISYTGFSQLNESVYPGTPYTNLSQVEVLNDYIYAIGSCNVGMISKDAGQTWTYFESDEKIIDIKIDKHTKGEKVYVLEKNKLFILDSESMNYQLISNDNLQLSAGTFKSIHISGNYIYLISNGYIHKAELGDFTWSRSTNFDFSDDFIRNSDITDNYIWVGTDKGKIFKVSLLDDTKTLLQDYDSRISSLEMVNDQLGYMIESSVYNIQKTTDGGSNFTPLPNMPEAINPVAFGENVVMSVNTNRFYISVDGGQNSTYIPTPKDGYTQLVYDHFMTDDGILYLVGKSGMIMKTEDFGQSFTHLNPFKRENLLSFAINDSGEGYALGGYSTFLHTIDNGETWIPTEINLSDNEDNYIQAVIAINNNRFLIGHNEGISIVENGAVVSTNTVSCDKLLKSKFNNNIFAVRQIASDYVISRSTDGGQTWINLINLPTYPSDLNESSSGQIYIPGFDGTIITSSDGGDNWNIINIGGIDEKIQKLSFFDENLGLISTGNNLYITRDGGTTTEYLYSDYLISNLHMFSDKHFLFTSAPGGFTSVKETVDAGENWENTNSFCNKVINTYYDDNKTVWLAQEGGFINKHIILEVLGTNNYIKTNYINVYPNPLAQGESLNIQKLSEEYKSADIYNLVTGKKVIQLSNISKNWIETNELEGGIYILKLTGDNHSSIAKFIIN